MNLVNCKTALKTLKSGLPIIFPTDTLPAIGCLPKFSEMIYKIKKRDIKKPLILMGAEKFQFDDFVHESALDDYKYIASCYWPGPLTIIVPISEKRRSFSTSSNYTIGLRIPNSRMAKLLLKESGPLLTSSANISGSPAATSAKEISISLPKINILGPVPWENCSGNASTIISWANHGKWKIIREGDISITGIN